MAVTHSDIEEKEVCDLTVQQLIDKQLFHVVNAGDDTDRAVTGVFCCDLLSIAMGKAPADSAWVTVMGNVNTIAVATLADVACVIIAEGAALDEVGRTRAKEQGVTVLSTDEPIFTAALQVHELL